jgi:hypothetical protein
MYNTKFHSLDRRMRRSTFDAWPSDSDGAVVYSGASEDAIIGGGGGTASSADVETGGIISVIDWCFKLLIFSKKNDGEGARATSTDFLSSS